ncbi:TetR/AcrR family transcriptional regulator [Pseudarthrobacter sp. NPDC092439]|uniref:TetR/AcrR family transcriptional regulator n=1 Tax=unclassified Pseudarthrobacter TaxID=2647000 RepID=UPI0038202D60
MRSIPLGPGIAPGPAPERSDAARNRERLLGAARELIREGGTACLTMDLLAKHAGVGKGTVFRRFGSRSGLLLALLDDSESAFQARFMFGPAPLGPGAAPLSRLVAYGTERIRYVVEFGDLVLAAEKSSPGRFEVPAAVLGQRHIDMLLRQSGFEPEPWLMAGALSATLDPERILGLVRRDSVSTERLAASWRDLVTRVLAGA